MDALEVLISSKENIRSKELKQKIEESKDFFKRRYNHYDNYATLGTFNILVNRNYNNIVKRVDQKANMILLYDKMTQEKTQVRKYYKTLREMTTKCPYCGFGTVSTLDHYLPKSKYPIYAVYPNNLVPSCYSCNTTKLASTDVTLHPYYDNVENEQWLFCEVICSDSIFFKYRVDQSVFNSSLYERIKTHFKVFDLQTSFTGFASDELSGYLQSIYTYLEQMNIDGLIADVKDRYDSNLAFKKNHWRTALYQALHNDSSWIEFLGK